jgi:antitoxin component of RelBE/YafQ-DinJ toxin-antitoxin module
MKNKPMKNDQYLSLKIDLKTKEKVTNLAETLRMSRSALVRLLVDVGINRLMEGDHIRIPYENLTNQKKND